MLSLFFFPLMANFQAVTNAQPSMLTVRPSAGLLMPIGAAIFLLLALMLVFRPYNGIYHDSILYFGQAIREIYPTELSKDLFFEFGSQSRYTLFPQLVAPLLRVFSLGTISMAGILLGYLFFLATAAFMAWQWLKKLPATARLALLFWTILSVLLWPSQYGGFGIFKYQEPYFTGRSLVEPLVLLSCGLMMARRPWLALLPLLAAAPLHPLQALPGFLLWGAARVVDDRRWLWAAVGGAAALALLAMAGVSPFGGLIQRYDDAWWDIVHEHNVFCFVVEWPARSWLALGADLFLFGAAWKYMPSALKRFSTSLVALTVGCLAASGLLADGLRLVLPTSLQLWRMHWLMHCAAVMLVPLIAWGLWQGHLTRQGPADDSIQRLGMVTRLGLLLLTLILAAPFGQATSTAWGILATIPLYFLLPWFLPKVQPRYRKILFAAVVTAGVASYVRFAAYILRPRSEGYARLDLSPLLAKGIPLLTHPIIVIVVVTLVYWLWHSLPKFGQLFLVGISAAIALSAAANWDQRLPFRAAIESRPIAEWHDPFATQIPIGARVFWPDMTLATWVTLHRSNYYNIELMSGVLFNRGTAIQGRQRHQKLAPLEFQRLVCETFNSLTNESDRCVPTRETVLDVCAVAKEDLDYIVIPTSVEGLKAEGQWNPAIAGVTGTTPYYLYHCGDLP